MNRDSISSARQHRPSCPPGGTGAASGPLRLPAWWLAGSAQYRPIYQARSEIHARDAGMAKNALVVMMAAVLAAVLLYSVDAAGAPAGQAGSGAMAVLTGALFGVTALWLLDRRLAQQIRDARLQALVWTDLVAAVRHRRVDIAAIEFALPGEDVVESLLRKELRVVLQFLAAREGVDLHLPVFDEGITLVRV